MSSPNTSKSTPRELSSEVRMLLAFGLMGLILVGSNWLYHKMGLVPADTPATQSAQTTQSKTQPAPKAASSDSSASTLPTGKEGSAASQKASETVAPIAASNK